MYYMSLFWFVLGMAAIVLGFLIYLDYNLRNNLTIYAMTPRNKLLGWLEKMGSYVAFWNTKNIPIGSKQHTSNLNKKYDEKFL